MPIFASFYLIRVCFLCFFTFFSPALGWYPYQRTDGFFSFFFTITMKKLRGFLGFKTKKVKTLFYPHQKSCLAILIERNNSRKVVPFGTEKLRFSLIVSRSIQYYPFFFRPYCIFFLFKIYFRCVRTR